MDSMAAKNLRLLIMHVGDKMPLHDKYYIQNLVIDGQDLTRSDIARVSNIRAHFHSPLRIVS